MPSVAIDLVTKAVHELIDQETLFPVGLGQLPSPPEDSEQSLEILEDGVAIVDPIDTPGDPDLEQGWIGQRDAMRRLWFEVTGYGLTAQQAQRVSHLAYQVITERTGGPDYVHDLTVAGHTVMSRLWVSQTPGAERVGLGFGYRQGNLIQVLVHASG